MNATMERVSSYTVKFRMELAADAFEAALQAAYLKMRGRINVPGFRKGKAPRKIIERMYGESIFYEEAFDAVFPDMYDEAVATHDAQVVARPEVDIETISAAEGLVVVAEVYVQPEITLGQYKGLEIEREDDTIDDEAVEQELGRLRQRNARETEVEDRPVQDDDIVTLNYAGTVDGVPFDGGTAENQTLTIGSGQFIPGFEEQMIGMQIGEERD
jgi:trigger factor